MTLVSFLQIGFLWEPAGPVLVGAEALPWPDVGPQADKTGWGRGWGGGACGGAPLPRAVLSKAHGLSLTDAPVRLGELGQLLKSWMVSIPACLEGRRGCHVHASGFPVAALVSSCRCTLGRRCGG